MGANTSKELGEFLVTKLKDPKTYLEIAGSVAGDTASLTSLSHSVVEGVGAASRGIFDDIIDSVFGEPDDSDKRHEDQLRQQVRSIAQIAKQAHDMYCNAERMGVSSQQARMLGEQFVRSTPLYRQDPELYERTFTNIFAQSPQKDVEQFEDVFRQDRGQQQQVREARGRRSAVGHIFESALTLHMNDQKEIDEGQYNIAFPKPFQKENKAETGTMSRIGSFLEDDVAPAVTNIASTASTIGSVVEGITTAAEYIAPLVLL